jgi:hypothetical protein
VGVLAKQKNNKPDHPKTIKMKGGKKKEKEIGKSTYDAFHSCRFLITPAFFNNKEIV